MKASQLTDRCTYHGEGSFWDAMGRRLLFVDMLAGAVVELRQDGSTARHEYGGVAAMIRARAGGGFVLAVEHGVRLLDADLAMTPAGVHVFDDPGIRMNEGGVDPAGRLFVGTMAYAQTPGAATLWRIDADGTASRAFGDVTISNGLVWSADGRSAFYVDTPTDQVTRFDYDVATGRFSSPAPFALTPPDSGHPDGMAIDAEGGLWVAHFAGSCVIRFDADGAVTERVELPVTRVTSCAFGGDDLRTLFITTSREDLPDDAEPRAGSVFAVEPGVAGAPVHAYAG